MSEEGSVNKEMRSVTKEGCVNKEMRGVSED